MELVWQNQIINMKSASGIWLKKRNRMKKGASSWKKRLSRPKPRNSSFRTTAQAVFDRCPDADKAAGSITGHAEPVDGWLYVEPET
jgi:hypothetical protein